MLNFARVVEMGDALALASTRLIELFANIDRLLKINSTLNITYTPTTKNATIANATDIWTSTAHGFVLNQKVRLTNAGGALPAGFLPHTDYFVIAGNLAANTFQLSATIGGASVNATGDGTGTHTVNPCPDYIVEETGGTSSNLSGRNYDRIQLSNAIGTFLQLRNFMGNVAVTQGDHVGNLNHIAIARAQG